jgi:hypothetical protein
MWLRYRFWRNYEAQTVLCIEEFTKPWIKHSDLLSILDGQFYRVYLL